MRAILLVIFGLACGGEPAEEAPSANSKCPKIAKDSLDGRWIRVAGSSGDTANRFEVKKTPDGGYTATFILGSFERIEAKGKIRPGDVAFTEVLTGEKLKRFQAGEATKRRIYVTPRLKKCSLQVSQLNLQMKAGKQVEIALAGRDEYLPFPDAQPFSFHTCDGPLFIGKAALKAKVANWEVSTNGGPMRSHQLGKKIPVGVWTDAATDGDASCTYDMDLWFDDRPVKDMQAIPAGKVVKGKRRWLIKEWSAPYSGNHHFMAERFKTCQGKRERIGVSCLDAVLSP